MSECVVRMKMPEKCDECPAWCICGTLHKYMLGIDCDSDWTYEDLLVITVETGFVKPDNCPILCQLPEGHGRLGDLDELADDVRSLWDYKTVDGITATTVLNQTLTDIRNCPTIVPAERSET